MGRNEKGQFTKGSCIHDLSDKVFGRLKVIELAEVKNLRAYWLCQCKCGKQKSIRGDALLSGRTNSCGCLKREMESSNLHITNPHGCKNHPVYHIWANMMSRCYSESNNKPSKYPYCDVALSDNPSGHYDLQGNEGSQNPAITITVYSNNYGDDECYDISMKAKELMLSYGFQCKTGPIKVDNADPAVARWVARYQRIFGSGDELRKLN